MTCLAVVSPHRSHSQRPQAQAGFRLTQTRQLSLVEFGAEPPKACDSRRFSVPPASAPRVVVVETTARPCAHAVHRPGPFRTTTAQRAPRRRSLWPTKGKRSPPPPPPLAPVGWDERATAAPGGSGARRDLQEIRSFAGRGCVMLSNTIRIRPSAVIFVSQSFSIRRIRSLCFYCRTRRPSGSIWIALVGFCREGRMRWKCVGHRAR